MATLINDAERIEVEAPTGDRWLIDPRSFETLTGWQLKPEGMCRADVCTPILRRDEVVVDGLVDLAAAAPLIGRSAVVDTARGVAALGASANARAEEMVSLQAPDFTLQNMQGESVSLHDFLGRKIIIVTFSSWCGCRYDLPVWQQIEEELGPHGLTVLAVAIDNDVQALEPFTSAAPKLKVVVDRDYVVAERYGIVNVPATVWIDETGRIVRPADIAMGDNRFREFAHVDADVHHELLRAWVLTGKRDLDDAQVADLMERPTPELQQARLHRRIAVVLHERGDVDGARAHLSEAEALAPMDWTIVRGSMPMNGKDPFGADFFAFVGEWNDAGRPGFRLNTGRDDDEVTRKYWKE